MTVNILNKFLSIKPLPCPVEVVSGIILGMRNRLSEEDIKALKSERRKGATVTVLMDKFLLPKTTVWHHVKDVVLSKSAAKFIGLNRGGSKKRKELAFEKAERVAYVLLKSNQRELIIAVSMLYWAEGHKKDFVFTNSDPKMVSLYLRFLREILKISIKDINILIRISDPIIPSVTLKYWSKELCLPLSCFKINHNNIQNRTKTKFGISRVLVRKSGFYLKIMQKLILILKKM